MDFLDPKKERRSRIMLLLGYCLVALAIGFATLVLLYHSFGYSVDRQGNVTQNGILFVSSQPSGAAIYLNGTRYKSDTNSRVDVPANNYRLLISKTGYRPWQRQVVVNGGDVQRFDYPFLFPESLQTAPLTELAADPSVATQSLDKRWVLLGQSDNSGAFTEVDLKNPAKPVATQLILPAEVVTASDSNGPQSWTAVEWATDNRHVLLRHTYTAKSVASSEYILLDRDTVANSVNITSSLQLPQTDEVSLFNGHIDALYVYNTADQTLQQMNATTAAVTSRLERVLAFKSYSDNKVLYITDKPPTGQTTAGLVSVVLQDGAKTTTLRTLPAGATTYSLNLTQYSGDWYVAVGASNDDAAYVYKNPQSQIVAGKNAFPVPWRRLPVRNPTFLSFSSSTQFILAENAQDFAVYDFENVVQYHYHATEVLDPPQTHAVWMDGNRLEYVSGGKLTVFDYDYRNRQSLVVASANYQPFFSQDFTYLYALQPATATVKANLSATPLVVKP